MGVCFICDMKLNGERTRVCSSVTPHTHAPYPEKIAELLGEEFVVIVTSVDHMCKRCTSLLTHMDKLENDLKLVRTAMLSYIQKKYGILPPDQPVKTLDVVNGHLKTEELETGQKKIPSGLHIRDNSVHTPLKMVVNGHLKTEELETGQKKIPSGLHIRDNSVHTPLKIIATAPPADVSGSGSTTSSTSATSTTTTTTTTTTITTTTTTTKTKIYKCGFCTFRSKELDCVRFHMRTHMKKDSGEKPTTNAVVATKPTAPIQEAQKIPLYRCQVCSKTFDSRMKCLSHIQIDHKRPLSSSTKEGKETLGDSLAPKNKQESVKPVANQQVDTGDKQDNKVKNVVNTNMWLNESVPPTEGNKQEETEKSGKSKPLSVSAEQDEEHGQGDNSQENDVAEKTEEDGSGEGMEVDEETPTVMKDNSENKSGDLDIESMLAAVHNDDTVEDGKDNVV